MEENNEYELIVHQKKRAIWELVISALFFTLMFFLIYIDTKILCNGINVKNVKSFSKTFGTIGLCLSGGIAFSVSKTVLIDIDKNKLISRFNLGPFSRDIISAVPQLDYISVYFNAKEDYEVNLWYKGNKHYKMYQFEEKSQAMKFALEVANKLKLDLLDKTVQGESEWIEYKPNYDVCPKDV